MVVPCWPSIKVYTWQCRLVAGLDVLNCGSSCWVRNSPLPRSLRALNLGTSKLEEVDGLRQVPQLCNTLRGLAALEHFQMSTPWVAPLLCELLAALDNSALTYLGLPACSLSECPPDFQFSASLEVVDISSNSDLQLRQWLPRLAALPQLRAINIWDSTSVWDYDDWELQAR